jgi:deoxyribonuclease-2
MTSVFASGFGPTFSKPVSLQKVAGVFGPTFSKPVSQKKVDCLNENGNPVDYWVAIKLPKGTDYFYYDSTDKNFHMSPHSLNNTVIGALAHTTKQLWLPDANYAIYNDQPPKYDDIDTLNASWGQIPQHTGVRGQSPQFGHTKGFFAFSNDDSGFWLTHSIPLFPIGPKDTNNYLGLGNNAWTYAQNLLCLSVSASALNDMAKLFLLNRPQLYDSHLTIRGAEYETIKNLVAGKYSTVKLCDMRQIDTTLFKLYAKTAEWNNDLYAGCVTPTERDTLWVESWIRGSAEGPTCPVSDYDTLDIKTLEFVVYGSIYSWKETQDHSKWAITANKDVVCMGDINRMTTQYSRGGGTVCFSDEILHSILKNATTKTNSCV